MLFDRGEVRTNNKKIIDLLQNSGWTQFSSSILDCKRLLIRMLSTFSKLAILVLITDKLNSIQPLFRCWEFKFGHVWSPAWKLYSLTQSNQPWWHLKLTLTCIYVRFVINVRDLSNCHTWDSWAACHLGMNPITFGKLNFDSEQSYAFVHLPLTCAKTRKFSYFFSSLRGLFEAVAELF